MHLSASSLKNLDIVVSLMRELSRQTDPQAAASLYGNGLRKLNLIPHDRYLSISRRDLKYPQYRITRSTSWKTPIDPWKQRGQLPLLSGGLLAEILYANEPVIIKDLPARLSKSDPAYDYLQDINLIVALPHFDDGEAINYGLLLNRSADTFPFDDLPMMIWQANLWGRATLNLVTRQQLHQAYQSLDRELKVVGDIQKSLLPRDLPAIDGVEIAAHYQTSQRAGGDYYDFFPLPENQTGIFVADVSGHGTPAAVMMAITHAIAHACPGHPIPPARMLGYLNEQLTRRYTAGTGTFITALYGILNPARRTFTWASAGHPLPRQYRRERVVATRSENALPLGISLGEIFSEQTLQLESRDKLLLYTDGIPEAFNPAGEQFALVRLDEVASRPASSAEDFIDHILTALATFTGDAPLTDDRTMLALVVR